MKSIRDILVRKKNSPENRVKIENDDKAIAKISQEITVAEVKNVTSEDIQEIYYKKNKLIIKTIHPVVASEIWKKREKIIRKINEFAGKEIVEKITIK